MPDVRKLILNCWRAAIIGAACAAVLAGAASPAQAGAQAGANDGFCDVAVEDGGVSHRFRAELAITPADRAQGLQGRTVLGVREGMLFDFHQPQSVAMWMKNTPIPLDMLFIDTGGEVVAIAERTVPYSLDIIASPGPVRAVLEVRGGTAERLGLEPGTRVTSPCLETLP